MEVEDKAKRLSLKYRVSDGNLYRWVSSKKYLFIPIIAERSKILKSLHDGHSHSGINVTWARLYRDYW